MASAGPAFAHELFLRTSNSAAGAQHPRGFAAISGSCWPSWFVLRPSGGKIGRVDDIRQNFAPWPRLLSSEAMRACPAPQFCFGNEIEKQLALLPLGCYFSAI